MPDPFPELNREHKRVLSIIADLIIPEDCARGKPSASEVDVVGFITSLGSFDWQHTIHELEHINRESRLVSGNDFVDMDPNDRTVLMSRMRNQDPNFLRAFATWTAVCYYQDARVMEAIGVPARPPFPLGHEVELGDTSLLEPVRARGQIYRKE